MQSILRIHVGNRTFCLWRRWTHSFGEMKSFLMQAFLFTTASEPSLIVSLNILNLWEDPFGRSKSVSKHCSIPKRDSRSRTDLLSLTSWPQQGRFGQKWGLMVKTARRYRSEIELDETLDGREYGTKAQIFCALRERIPMIFCSYHIL